MFTIIGRCVARKNYVYISKVKVILKVQRSKMAINELVRAVTMLIIVRILNHLAHLFTIIGRCVARKNYVDISKVKVTLGVQRSNACPGHNFAIYREILSSFGKFVYHHWTVCRAKELR